MSWSDMPTVHDDPLPCQTCGQITIHHRVIYRDEENRTCTRCGRKEQWVPVRIEHKGKVWVLKGSKEDVESRRREDTDTRLDPDYKSSRMKGVFRRKRRKKGK